MLGMRWFDLPPFWLIACLTVTWLSPWRVPWGPLIMPGLFIIALAMLLTFAALAEFRRAKTTVIPGEAPSALITSGVFRWSRNPIYLADLVVLVGFAVLWGKVLGFLLVPVFAVLLDRRFIRGEEARLREAFGEAFDAAADRVVPLGRALRIGVEEKHVRAAGRRDPCRDQDVTGFRSHPHRRKLDGLPRVIKKRRCVGAH